MHPSAFRMDDLYENLGISIVFVFELNGCLTTATVKDRLERMERFHVWPGDIQVKYTVQNIQSLDEVDSIIGALLVPCEHFHCFHVHIEDEHDVLLFQWPHSWGDADYGTYHIAGIFDETVSMRQSIQRKFKHHPKFIGWKALAHSTWDAIYGLVFHHQPRRDYRSSCTSRVLRTIGSVKEWKETAAAWNCSVNDLFLWTVQQAIASVEGHRNIYLSAVRNHRSSLEIRNDHAQTVVRLKADTSLNTIRSNTTALRSWPGVVYWCTTTLPSKLVSFMFKYGEPSNAGVTSNINLQWMIGSIDGCPLHRTYATTIHQRTGIHLVSNGNYITIVVSSFWNQSEDLVNALQHIIDSNIICSFQSNK